MPTSDPISILVEFGEEHGCVNLTELNELVHRLELEEEDVEACSSGSKGSASR